MGVPGLVGREKKEKTTRLSVAYLVVFKKKNHRALLSYRIVPYPTHLPPGVKIHRQPAQLWLPDLYHIGRCRAVTYKK